MKRELLEVRELDFATLRDVQVRALRALQRPLDNRVWNMEKLGKRPVGPHSIVGNQATENIDVGILDHHLSVSDIDT